MCRKNEYMHWPDYFNADSDAEVFGLDWYPTL